MRSWLELQNPVDLATYGAALTEREGMLFRWMSFLQQWPLVILPTLADLPPKQVADTTVAGQKAILESMRPALMAPLLGLPGLAVPVGNHGKLRTGVQIMAMRNREDLCLDAGEVIEAAEGVVVPIDPAAA
jgi:amidase